MVVDARNGEAHAVGVVIDAHLRGAPRPPREQRLVALAEAPVEIVGAVGGEVGHDIPVQLEGRRQDHAGVGQTPEFLVRIILLQVLGHLVEPGVVEHRLIARKAVPVGDRPVDRLARRALAPALAVIHPEGERFQRWVFAERLSRGIRRRLDGPLDPHARLPGVVLFAGSVALIAMHREVLRMRVPILLGREDPDQVVVEVVARADSLAQVPVSRVVRAAPEPRAKRRHVDLLPRGHGERGVLGHILAQRARDQPAYAHIVLQELAHRPIGGPGPRAHQHHARRFHGHNVGVAIQAGQITAQRFFRRAAAAHIDRQALARPVLAFGNRFELLAGRAFQVRGKILIGLGALRLRFRLIDDNRLPAHLEHREAAREARDSEEPEQHPNQRDTHQSLLQSRNSNARVRQQSGRSLACGIAPLTGGCGPGRSDRSGRTPCGWRGRCVPPSQGRWARARPSPGRYSSRDGAGVVGCRLRARGRC